MDHGKPGGATCAWMPAAMGTRDMALLGFVCFIFFLAYGSSAPVRIKHASVMAAWITGVLALPDMQEIQWPWAQQLWYH